MKSKHLLLFLQLQLLLSWPVTPFSPSSSSRVNRFITPFFQNSGNLLQKDTRTAGHNKGISQRSLSSSSSSSSSKLGLFPALSIANSSPILRTTAILGAIVAILWKNNWKRLLWPKSNPDPNYADIPLPPGSLGCPLLGQLFFLGNKEKGIGNFWYQKDKIFQGARIWKSYILGMPMVVVTGGKTIASVLNQEFDPLGVRPPPAPMLIGKETLFTCTKAKDHTSMRKLIGSAMTPAACNAATPNIQAMAEKQVEKMIQRDGQNGTIMRDICTKFTLDVAWRQILGLDLKTDTEIDYFYQMVDIWVKGVASVRSRSGMEIGIQQTKAYKAREYIVTKVNEKIDSLLQHGPDETTMSGMVFATDDDDDDGSSRKKLTRDQVIDNAMLLILAGSETSASTLTNVMLLLGLHRNAWDKLVQEQSIIQSKYGDTLERDILEKECPYLEGVIKETMRMFPLVFAAPREALTTKLMNGFQIPRGWKIFWNILLTHIHDPTTYKNDLSHMDPLKGFQPERWLDKQTRPSDDFIPMGIGPRYCLGSTLAYTEMKVFLAVLARTIDFKLVKDPQQALVMKRVSIMPLPADGVVINVWPSLNSRQKTIPPS